MREPENKQKNDKCLSARISLDGGTAGREGGVGGGTGRGSGGGPGPGWAGSGDHIPGILDCTTVMNRSLSAACRAAPGGQRTQTSIHYFKFQAIGIKKWHLVQLINIIS